MLRSKSSGFIILVVLAVLLATGLASAEPKFGGTVMIAISTEPANLDIQMMPADVISNVAQHIFEQLFAFDEAFGVRPMLAESYEMNPEGTLYTIRLRQGVPFHNGKEMTSEDVVASLLRWGRVASRGATAFNYIEEVEAVDQYTISLELRAPFAPLLSFLAFQNTAASIMPKEIAEKYPDTPMSEYIGTGPYKFVRWLPDYVIRLERFDDYASRDDEPSGWAGSKIAYFDAVEYYTVLEAYTRQAGVQAGEYHAAYAINREAFEELDGDPNVVTHLVVPGSFGWVIFNNAQGIMTNQTLRQAALAALDMEPILKATHGLEEFYTVSGSYYPDTTIWYSEAGTEWYNQNDHERARELMAQAGYNNEPIRFIAAGEVPQHLSMSMVVTSQWQAAGLNVDLQYYDWATILSRRVDPTAYDVFVTGHGFVPDPSLLTNLSSAYAGWWDTPTKNDLRDRFQSEPDSEKRMELWAELQELYYEEVPAIRFGEHYNLLVTQPQLQGFVSSSWPFYWNLWLE